MPHIRRNIVTLPGDWNDIILWYARGVGALRGRATGALTSWRYFAAIHGVHEGLWRAFGYLADDEELPDTSDFRDFDRDQCQHHTWYFLPWHRGYLAAFEATVRQAIVDLGGPGDWALPYWDYSDRNNPSSRDFPAAFASPTLPDGADNPLHTPRRYGIGDGTIMLRSVDVDLENALTEEDFDGDAAGGSPGFGGAPTPFQHSANRRAEGFLEQLPHDTVHGAIGGSWNNSANPLHWGLMSNPATAALDPIFWLHHANIDRLWEVWRLRASGRSNPSDAAWLDGPAGTRMFVMPQPDGSRRSFTARDMIDTLAPTLDYEYEDVSDPLPASDRLLTRLRMLELTEMADAVPDVSKKPVAELMGTTLRPVRLSGPVSATTVEIDRPTAAKANKSFRPSVLRSSRRREPDRFFLNLENITGVNDAARFDVYVGLPDDEDPRGHPENFAGVVSLFGLSEATLLDRPHGGSGLNKVLEITKIIDRLHLSDPDELRKLPVRFLPVNAPAAGDVEIGRVSIYRQTR